MRQLAAVLVLIVAAVAPANAQEQGSTIAVGYSLATYLETGGGVAPLGFSLSASTVTRQVGIEADLAFHRDDGLHTVTAAAGRRWEKHGVTASPFVHVMFLFRHDSFWGTGNTSVGTMAGFGTDMGRGEGAGLRLALDVQIVVDSGEFFKVLRTTAGVAF